jgi:hypothetical protein
VNAIRSLFRGAIAIGALLSLIFALMSFQQDPANALLLMGMFVFLGWLLGKTDQD